MKKIKSFSIFSINENESFKMISDPSYKLPSASGSKNPEKDEEDFWFSTKNIDTKTGKSNKSLVLDCFIEIIQQKSQKLKDKEITPQNFYCEYKPGNKFITYNYHFYTPDEEVVKKSQGKYDGHEWRMQGQIPSDIIEKLNQGEIDVEEAKKRIDSEASWALFDGMDPEGLRTGEGGWQLSFIMNTEEVDRWIEEEKKSRAWQPQWLKNFRTWITDKFG